jgi:hypothetical protein
MLSRRIFLVFGASAALLAVELTDPAARARKRGRTLTARKVKLHWSSPSCFGYSKSTRGYACLDFAVGADNGVPGLMDFEKMKPPPSGSGAWNGHKSIVLLAPKKKRITKRYGISEKKYDSTARKIQIVDQGGAGGDQRGLSITGPSDQEAAEGQMGTGAWGVAAV